MTDEEDTTLLYALIGLTLIQVQQIERMLQFCMGVVFRDAEGKTLSDLTNPKTRKQTLGQFIYHLRRTSDLDPGFDKVIGTFLEHRNQFVHNLTSRDPGMRFDSQHGRQHVRVFVRLFCTEIDTVSKALLGFIMRWADPEKYADLTRVRVQFPEGSYLGDVEQVFAPHTAKLISPKPASADGSPRG